MIIWSLGEVNVILSADNDFVHKSRDCTYRRSLFFTKGIDYLKKAFTDCYHIISSQIRLLTFANHKIYFIVSADVRNRLLAERGYEYRIERFNSLKNLMSLKLVAKRFPNRQSDPLPLNGFKEPKYSYGYAKLGGSAG